MPVDNFCRKINESMSLDIINIAACLLVYFALIKGFKNVPEFVKLT